VGYGAADLLLLVEPEGGDGTIIMDKNGLDKWQNLDAAQAKLVALFRELIDDPGYGELRVDVKTLKKGNMEVVLSCGKKYRFVLKLNPPAGEAGKEKSSR